MSDQERSVVWDISPPGVTTIVAGKGSSGPPSGDDGPAASATLNSPIGLAVDAAGDLFIADSGNSRIRKVTGVAAMVTAPVVSMTDANPLAHEFVIPLYVNVLGIQPDPGGLFTWVNFLRGNCNADGFSQVALGFFDPMYGSQVTRPFSLTGQVTLLYQTFLGRPPDPDGAAWINVLRQARLSIALQGLIRS